MDYQETVEYLFTTAPLFQNIGAEAYKEGLENTRLLDAHFNHPHTQYHTLHIAGTNGKGSCSHTLAAILQSAGYRVGLFTSPHLIDFRERIRVNGVPIEKEKVVEFVERERSFFEPLHPSFFELTTAMAFNYFAGQKVDVAVIEVGLGGRLDCTNIIRPDLAVITNISLDHTQFLGGTLGRIATEKAGIIKNGIPAVIGEALPETRPIFVRRAQEVGAPLFFAEDEALLTSYDENGHGFVYQSSEYPDLQGELCGFCQAKNTATLLSAIAHLKAQGYRISERDVRNGFAHVCSLTGLRGRWEVLRQSPTVVCDTGHNPGGIAYIARQLKQKQCRTLRIVFGMAADKDVETVLSMLPAQATYYFTQASVKRAMPATRLQQMAERYNLHGNARSTVKTATLQALADAAPDDYIYIGGSSFVVADLLGSNIQFHP